MENTAPPGITDNATFQQLKAALENFRSQHEEFTALTREAQELREENARLKKMLEQPTSKPS